VPVPVPPPVALPSKPPEIIWPDDFPERIDPNELTETIVQPEHPDSPDFSNTPESCAIQFATCIGGCQQRCNNKISKSLCVSNCFIAFYDALLLIFKNIYDNNILSFNEWMESWKRD